MSDTAMEPGQGGAAPLPASYDMSEVGDWIALLKPRVMTLVVFSGLVGMLVAPGALAMNPVLAATAILCIAIGAGEAIFLAGRYVFTSPQDVEGARRQVWRRFARWIVLALEFALAADIARTAISPTWDDIGQLAAIAVIRTALNYFLERDLEEFSKPRERRPRRDAAP